MKKLLSTFLALIITLSLFGGFNFFNESSVLNAEAASGLYVKGSNLFDANGNRLVLRGVNISHAWYQGSTMNNISKAKSYGCNAVRIVCADGQRWSKTDYNTLKNIIQTCVNNGLICVLEVHDTTDSDSVSSLNAAVNYWKEMKSLLNQYSKYVIVNIANEWMASWEMGADWQSGYINAVRSLRNAGITNVLMVDAPGYAQEVNAMYQYCRGVRDADTTGNIMFSIHMYADAGKDAATVKSGIDAAYQMGICLCIGEFGCAHGTRDVDEYTIMSHCKTRQVSYFAWSWYGNSGTDKQLDLFYDEYGSSMTSWGKTVFNSTNGIKNTSVLAYRTNNWTVDPVIDVAGEKNDSDGNNIFLSGKMFIGRQGGTGVTIATTTTNDADFGHTVIEVNIGTIKANGGYYNIVFDRESVPTTNTMGVGFWYKTPAGQTVNYNMYYDELAIMPVAIELPATNGDWKYIYIPWNDLGGRPASVTTCKMYFNKLEDKNFAGKIYFSEFAVTNIMDEEGNIATDIYMGGNFENGPSTDDTDTESDTETDTEPKPVGTYTVTAKASNASYGTVTGSGSYKAGTNVTVTAKANSGYEFVNWTYNDLELSSNETFTFEAWEEDITLIANFRKSNTSTDTPTKTYKVTVQASNTSYGTVTGSGSYKAGTNVTVTAKANSGYEFVNWTYNDLELSSNETFTFEAWEEDITLIANFKKAPEVEILLGDVNNDGVVNIVDVVMMRSHIVNMKTLTSDQITRGDINKDKKISIVDVVMARNIVITKQS